MATHILPVTAQGPGCPVAFAPARLPLHKKLGLFFFRFGACPLCIMGSVGYGLVRLVRGRGWPNR